MAEMRLGEPDDSGRRRPEPIPGAEREVELDTLIVAIGQRPDLSLFGDEDVKLNSSGYLEVDPATLETSIPGVYAGGDIIGDGPSNIVKACGDGRIIADAIIARHRSVPETPRSSRRIGPRSTTPSCCDAVLAWNRGLRSRT